MILSNIIPLLLFSKEANIDREPRHLCASRTTAAEPVADFHAWSTDYGKSCDVSGLEHFLLW